MFRRWAFLRPSCIQDCPEREGRGRVNSIHERMQSRPDGVLCFPRCQTQHPGPPEIYETEGKGCCVR